MISNILSFDQLTGESWKNSRNLVTPMFTSSKLKAIMPLMHKCGEDLSSYLNNFEGFEIDCKEVYQRYTIEILGTLGCGIKPGVLGKQTNVFYDQACNTISPVKEG